MTNSAVLWPGLAEAIRAHGVETYPHECCGGLIGSRRDDGRVMVTALVPLPNTTEEGPRRRFLVRPADYRLAETHATELRGELVGFYHSHPDHPARPSQYDLDHAWPTFAYVIVSVMGAGLSDRSAADATAEGAIAGLARRGGEATKAGDMTVWFLADDRSAFNEGSLTDGEHNPDTNPAEAVYRQA